MDDTVYARMMELCMSLGSMGYHDRKHNEEEALLYQQICRTLNKKAKLDEMILDATQKEIEAKTEVENAKDEGDES